jgi:hypothetical protein
VKSEFFRRSYAAFFSYASADAALAAAWVRWLKDFAGLAVWYDAKEIDAGQTAAAALERAVRQARAYVLLLTPQSLQSRWVAHEHEVAQQQSVEHAAFRRIALVTPDVDPAEIPASLARLTQIRLPAHALDGASAAKLLASLRADAGPPRSEDDIFITRTWREQERPAALFADRTCAWLADKAGYRLVGDEPRTDEDAHRQRNIIASCAAYLALVPPREPQDLVYLLRELPIAQACGLPMVVVADPSVVALEREGRLHTPDGQPVRFDGARVLTAEMGGGSPAPAGLSEEVDRLLQEAPRARSGPRDSYAVFYAGDPAGLDRDQRDDIQRVVRGITGRGCVFPDDIDGEAADRMLLQQIAGSVATIADLSPGHADAWVLAGAARASQRPLTLVSGDATFDAPMPRLLSQYKPRLYRSHAERLGLVHAALYTHRRLFLNQEVLRWT